MQDNGAERRTRAALACLDRTPENFWERNDAQFELDKYEEFFKILARGPHTVPPRRVEEAKQRRKQARTRKARDLLADAQSATSLERQAYYINAFCALVAGGEHTIADREGQEAKAILKLRATKEAKGWLAEVRSQFLVAQSNNFAGAQSKKSATREALNKVLANAWSLQECVGYGADVPSNDFEDARIALAMALFALQRYDEALAEATAFTTKCPEHKRPMPWMIQAHILNGSKKDAAHKAYLVARARRDALEPHERKGEMIGKKFTINTLAELFPRPQSSRPAKRQRAASSSGGGGDGGGDGGSAPLTAKVCGAELEISSAFICTRVDSMKARIAAKRKRLEEGSLTEKQLIFYGEEWAEECIGSWSDDHVDEVQLRDLWIRQGGLCALSGQLMSTRINDPNVGSVDRKDSRRGYTADNVQWVCAWANYMKSSMPEGLFFQRCMTLGSRYTEWSLQKMADMEEQLLERKRETGEQPDEAEEQEGKGKEKMDSH